LPRVADWVGAKLGNLPLQELLLRFKIDDSLPLFPGALGERFYKQQTFGVDCSFLMYAAGAIMGIRIGGVVPASNCISMFLGALAAWFWSKRNSKQAGHYCIPGASGLIAGEALMAVAIILFAFVPSLVADLFGP
jgi:hypothetical protein